jgi:hypothetical protein
MTRAMQRLYARAWLSGHRGMSARKLYRLARWCGGDWFWDTVRRECRRRFAACVAAGALAGLLLAL